MVSHPDANIVWAHEALAMCENVWWKKYNMGGFLQKVSKQSINIGYSEQVCEFAVSHH
jgi:hypothetical protein